MDYQQAFEQEMIEKANDLLIDKKAKENFSIKITNNNIVLEIANELLKISAFSVSEEDFEKNPIRIWEKYPIPNYDYFLMWYGISIKKCCRKILFSLHKCVFDEIYTSTSESDDLKWKLMKEESIQFFNYVVERWNYYVKKIIELQFGDVGSIIFDYVKIIKFGNKN